MNEFKINLKNKTSNTFFLPPFQWDWSLLLCVVFHLITLGAGCALFFNAGLELEDKQYSSFTQYVSVWPRIPETDKLTIWTQLATWDAGNYLQIASTGYENSSPLNAFYPLWPALIWPVSNFLGPVAALVWGFFLSNFLFLCSIHLLTIWIQETHGKSISHLTIALIVFFPGSIFFSLIYTESLFLFFSVLTLYALQRQRYRWVVLGAFLLPLIKAIGIFIVLPMIIHSVRKRKTAWVLIAPLAGYFVYFVFFLVATGNPFAGFSAQNQFLNQPSIQNIFDVPAFIGAFGNASHLIHPTNGLLDRIVFLVFCLTIPALVITHKPDLALFCLAIGIIPALSNHLLSYFRFFSVCFPIFITWAIIVENKKLSKLFIGFLLFLFCVLKFLMLQRYLSFQWVS